MQRFFIEMGQGIVLTGEAGIQTSTIYNCVLIAGYNEENGKFGAYHYPSKMLERGKGDDEGVRADMKMWVRELAPTEVILVFARSDGMVGGTSGKDKENLIDWVRRKCGVDPGTTEAVKAVAVYKGGKFWAGAGNMPEAATALEGEPFDLTKFPAGVHGEKGGFHLFGKDREIR